LLDAEAAMAIGHAIEDLALEEANGSLLGAFQGSEYFEPHRERYRQLAATIDQSRCWRRQNAKPARRIKFFKDTGLVRLTANERRLPSFALIKNYEEICTSFGSLKNLIRRAGFAVLPAASTST